MGGGEQSKGTPIKPPASNPTSGGPNFVFGRRLHRSKPPKEPNSTGGRCREVEASGQPDDEGVSLEGQQNSREVDENPTPVTRRLASPLTDEVSAAEHGRIVVALNAVFEMQSKITIPMCARDAPSRVHTKGRGGRTKPMRSRPWRKGMKVRRSTGKAVALARHAFRGTSPKRTPTSALRCAKRRNGVSLHQGHSTSFDE